MQWRWARNLMISFLLITLIGCGNDSALEPPTNQPNGDIDLTKISTNSSVSQHHANRAKEILSHYQEITTVKAVNTDKHMLIAIEIQHGKRFQLGKIREQLTKQMKKEFKDLKVELSTDKKIVMELEKLEKSIQSKSYSKKKLEKKLKKLIEFSKEQT
ncbi:hypothetical protein RVS70_14170 [Virgibacillus sp. M23]|uniref:hypothetical protein n=1 Tax=Virgibacillus sp. M23 TaxID=3079030 RepID=UPI002A915088|nr:hypothetical protein [Virgibacillus sp. M23]MDY7045349.1 hypothetical protein [Virgibacillus sp. M23]